MMRVLRCYRLPACSVDYDELEICQLVEQHQGYLTARQDCIDM